MFGRLKKKLQEAVKKVSAAVAEDKPIKHEAPVAEPEVPQIKEQTEELKKEARETLLDLQPGKEKYVPKKKDEEFPLEQMKEKEDEILREKEKLDELVNEKTIEKDIQKKSPSAKIPEYEKHEIAIEESRKGILSGIVKKVSQKRLEEGDITKITGELQMALLENDVSMETSEKIISDLKKELTGKSVPRTKIESAIRDALRSSMLGVMSHEKIDMKKLINHKFGGPFLIMFIGFNGVGKTTNLSKLASMLREHKPVLAAGDTFRAASIEQLEEHGRRLGMKVVKHSYGSDSAAVIFDAVKHAKASGSRVVLADTAGRSHANVNLMDELKKICRVNKPDMKILVLDSLTGNDIYDQVRMFNEAVGIDGIILSKADVYDKGGAALSATHTSGKPILFLGTGQEYSDLKEFNPEEIVKSLLD